MRNLLLALLLLNVLFFGWAHWLDRPRNAANAASSVAQVPTLELAQLPAPRPVVLAATHCRSVGPFADAGAAAATAEALRSRGLVPRSRSVESSVPDGYWVYVENLKDAAARRKVISTLNSAGMRDAVAMPDESDRVSVGVFTDQKHAVHRAEQVQELGFKPVLSVHQRPVSAAWLDVDLKLNDADPAPANADNAKVIDCPIKSDGG